MSAAYELIMATSVLVIIPHLDNLTLLPAYFVRGIALINVSQISLAMTAVP